MPTSQIAFRATVALSLLLAFAVPALFVVPLLLFGDAEITDRLIGLMSPVLLSWVAFVAGAHVVFGRRAKVMWWGATIALLPLWVLLAVLVMYDVRIP
jgi:hypothetical protein